SMVIRIALKATSRKNYCLAFKLKIIHSRAVLSPPRPPALRGGFNAVALTRSRRVGRGVICRK
ncbi:TPA: hypothetical protein ACNTV0_003736, partial [Escherichia coli]